MPMASHTIQWMPYLVFVLAVIISLSIAIRVRHAMGQLVTLISFGIYLIVVGYLTLTPTSYGFGIIPTMTPFWIGNVPTNPIPFRGIEMDFYLNIMMMIPMGVYLGLFRPSGSWRILLSGLAIGVGIESCQFLLDTFLGLSRWVDINDIITNAAGVVIGYTAVMALIHSPFKRLVQFFSLERYQI